MDIILEHNVGCQEYLICRNARYIKTTLCKFNEYGNCYEEDFSCKKSDLKRGYEKGKHVKITVVDDMIIEREDNQHLEFIDLTKKEQGKDVEKWYKVWQKDRERPNPFRFSDRFHDTQVYVSAKNVEEYKKECILDYLHKTCGIKGILKYQGVAIDIDKKGIQFMEDYGLERDQNGEITIDLEELEVIEKRVKKKEKIKKLIS